MTWSVEAGLEDEAEEEGPGEGHVVDVEHVGSVGQHRVDVDFLDVWLVRHGVIRHLEITHMFDMAIVSVDTDELFVDLVKLVLETC